MISLIEFQFWTCISAIIAFILGFATLSPCFYGLGGKIIFGIVSMALITSMVIGTLDSTVIESTQMTTLVSSKIVDSYDGGHILWWTDLSIRLDNGKILKYDDPYMWKKFTVGSYYNYSRYDYFSYIEGNATKLNYAYVGVI